MTVNADFSHPTVHIATVLVLFFSIGWFIGMSKVGGDAVELDMLVGNLFTAVGTEDGQLFFGVRRKLPRHDRPCPDGELAPFHRTKAPRRTSWTVETLLPAVLCP